MLNFGHNRYFIDEKLMVFPSNLLLIDDLDCIVLARIVFQVAIVYRAILALTEETWSEHDLNLIAWECNHFTTGLHRVYNLRLLCVVLHC